MMLRTSHITLCLLLPLLGACVMLERAPTALTCDPDLAGRWIPLAGDDERNPLGREDYALVDAQCRVALIDDRNISERPSFTARGFRVGEARYLALSQDDMRGLFNDRSPPKPSGLPETAVLPVKYRFVDEVIELELPDLEYVRDLVAQGKLKALELNALVVQGEDDALLAMLAEHPAMFDSTEPLPDGTTGMRDSYRFRLRRAGPSP